MISRDMLKEYRRMNSEDRNAFHRWLTLNMVVGACILTIVTVMSIYSGGTAQEQETIAEIK
jgi:hypothetical protein